MRSRNSFRHCTCSRVASGFAAGWTRRHRRSATLAHPVLGEPRDSRAHPQMELACFEAAEPLGGRLDQLHQNPASIFRVNEVDF